MKASIIQTVILGTLVSTLTISAATVITIPTIGMASKGSDRWGSAFGWEPSGWERPEVAWAGHSYDTSWHSGSQRMVYMQVPIQSLYDLKLFEPTSDYFQSITLDIFVQSTGGAGSSLNHIATSSSADGDATQGLSGGSQFVADINGLTNTWHSIDVTTQVISDLIQGHTFSVFTFSQKSNSDLYFRSSSYNDPSFHPTLSATHIPEPRIYALLVGLASLAFVVHRRRNRLIRN